MAGHLPQDQAQAQAQAPAQDQVPDQAQAQDQGAEVLETIKKMGIALEGINQAMQGAGAPPEALQALNGSLSLYQEFLSIITGQGAQRPSQVPADQAGAQGVRPEGQPGPGAIPAQA